MFLAELWTQYLSKTMPTLTAMGLPLACIQMLGGLPPLLSLYRSVQRDNAGERILLCMVPGIFILTAAIVSPLFFGSFLGAGFPWTDALQAFLFQPAFFREGMALSGVFWVLLIFSRSFEKPQGRFSSIGVLFSIGAELLASAALFVLGVDYFGGKGQFFLALKEQPLKWLVYGYYLLWYQVGLLVLCFIWRLLFSERKERIEIGSDYGRWLRRYFARGYRVYGWSMLMFAGLWAYAVVYGLYREGSEFGWAIVINIILVIFGIGSFVRSMILPGNYYRILSWGNPDQTLWQLYHELVELPPLVSDTAGFLTEHYLVLAMPRRIFCRHLLEKESMKITWQGLYWLRFRDGSTCKINRSCKQLLASLIGESSPNSTSRQNTHIKNHYDI